MHLHIGFSWANLVCVNPQITCTGQLLAADTPPQPAGPPGGTLTDTLLSLPLSSESGNTNKAEIQSANTHKRDYKNNKHPNIFIEQLVKSGNTSAGEEQVAA